MSAQFIHDKWGPLMGEFFFYFTAILFLVSFFAVRSYNGMRTRSESIREAWSNIGVTAKKQVSLINQLIEAVRSYQESEKLVMLKVSEDMSTAAGLAQMHQQSGVVLSTVSGLAQRFPELKSSTQYQQLMKSIDGCETQLESARTAYNGFVKEYNVFRTSIPTVFIAPTLGFRQAPYLEFDGNNLNGDIGTLQNFASDADGERLNALLGSAGGSMIRLGGRAVASGGHLAAKAIESSKALIEAAQDRARESASPATAAEGSCGSSSSPASVAQVAAVARLDDSEGPIVGLDTPATARRAAADDN